MRGHTAPQSVAMEKAKAWLDKGAQPSDTVARLFRQAGVLAK